MDGVLNVLKPPGLTSHDVVVYLRRKLHTKKIGHAGTLDPQAVGVLPLGVGKATRLLEFMLAADKEYWAELTFGITTDTQDAWGRVLRTSNCADLSLEEIKSKLGQFMGEIKQTPPDYSAVKVNGIPLYKRSRLGLETKISPRTVFVYDFKIIKYKPPRLIFKIHCSKGTYIRTICHDLGESLGVGAHLSFLLRTRVGGFSIAESILPEKIGLLKEKALLPLEIGVENLKKLILTENELVKIRHGQKVFLPEFTPLAKNIAIFNHQGELEAIAEILSQEQKVILKPKKVLKRD